MGSGRGWMGYLGETPGDLQEGGRGGRKRGTRVW